MTDNNIPLTGRETSGSSGSTWATWSSGATWSFWGLSSFSRLSGFIALIALIAFSGCSADPASDATEPSPQPVEEINTPIVFSALQEEGTAAVTRAWTSLGDRTATFTVYGYKNMGYDNETGYTDLQTVFPGYTVNWIANSAATTVTNTHNWEYVAQKSEQTIKYWDWDARAYRFFGVAAGGTSKKALDNYDVNKPYERRTATESTVTIPVNCNDADEIEATPYYSNLWFSAGQPTQPQFGDPVQLEFIKPVANVCIKFIFEDPTMVNTPLDNISFYPTNGAKIAIEGNLIVTYPLTGTATTATVTIERFSVTGFDALTEIGKLYTVLPVIGQGTYSLSVYVGGKQQSCVVPAEYMNWAPGYEYTYIFKVHVDGGVGIDIVQSAFKGWTLIAPKDHTVYDW